ncbi:MAG: hypothetical protein CMJ87_02935 [Planctomycetes bacterium]|nr:hypothetical protein [Planctomycetota bacterium]
MLPLFRSLLVLVPLLAALDSVTTALGLPRPPAAAVLFMQSLGLWALLGLAALVPALATERFFAGPRSARKPEDWAPGPVALAWWMTFPVLAHARLDAHTGLGGDLAAVLAPRPLGELLALVVASLVLARWAAGRLSRLRPRPLGPLLAVAALLIGALLPLGAELPAGRGVERDPSGSGRAAAESPNILVLVWDTARAMNLTPYGAARNTTPRLAELAAHSMVFEEARSVSCFTLTSHLSMLTGVYPSHHGASMGRMFYDALRTPPITQALARGGYRTGGFVGTAVLRAQTGMDHGFEVFDDRVDPAVCATSAWSLVHDVQSLLARYVPAMRFNGRPHVIQDFDRPGEEVLERALSWIAAPDPRPWFALVNLYDVHWPYLPEDQARRQFVRPYDGMVDGYVFRSDSYPQRPPELALGARLKADDNRHLEDLYDAELWQLDRAVGEFLDALRLADSNTAVLVVSDHGEAFGEGGRYEHMDITEPQVRVPFVVYLPRTAGAPRPPSGRRRGRVSGVDVAATALGLAGLEVPQHMQGLDLLAAEVPDDRPLLVEDRDKLNLESMHLAYYKGPWKLVQSGLGQEPSFELFNLELDQGGLEDLAAQHPQVVAELVREMTAMRATWEPDGEGGLGGGAGSRALRGLGYVGD